MGCDSPRTGVEARLSHAFSLQLLSLNGNNISEAEYVIHPVFCRNLLHYLSLAFPFILKWGGGEREGGQGSGLKEEAWHWEAD